MSEPTEGSAAPKSVSTDDIASKTIKVKDVQEAVFKDCRSPGESILAYIYFR